MNNVYSKDYEINIYDVDSDLKCKFSTIVNYLWDVVMSQTEALGETKNGLINQCAWILLKYDIKIHEYPKYKDVINVENRVVGVKKFYGVRDYIIRNSEGKVLAEGRAIALLVNMEKRRPMRLLPEQYELYGITGDLEEDIELDNIKEVENIEYSRGYVVRFSDIDSNKHVNNLKYMEMAMDTLPFEFLNDHELSEIKIVFKKETTFGDTIKVSSELKEEENGLIRSIHSMIGNNDKLLTKVEFGWRS